MKLSKHSPKNWLVLWLPVVMLALLPTLSSFLGNRFEVSAQDLVLPVMLDVILASFVAAVFYRLFVKDHLAGFTTAVIVILILGYGYEPRLQSLYAPLSAIVPISGLSNSAQGLVISGVFMGLALVISCWAGQHLSRWAGGRKWASAEIITAVTLAITVAFLFQFLSVARSLASEWPQFFYQPPALKTTSPLAASTKPDIYYIVLDRYASQSVLTGQFGFDNSDFMKFLQAQGYYVNADAHNNYPYTTMSIASTLSANYLTDLIHQFSPAPQQTIIPYHATIRSSPVIQQLKKLGYRYDLIGNWYETSNQSPLADQTYQKDGLLTILGHTMTLNNFSKNELTGGPFNRLVNPGLPWIMSYSAQTGPDQPLYQLNQLQQLASQPAGGRVIMAHILVPHDPYFFNADGSLATNTGDDNVGEPIKQKYLGQVQFINTQMKTILNQINQSSHGQAVVVLQADEGPYPIQLNDQNFNEASAGDEVNNLDMRMWSDDDLKMKFGNLAAYRITGASDQDLVTAGDPVNIFRLIFNTYFNQHFDYLPRCYYAYPNGRSQPFVYADITQRLTGHTNQACSTNNKAQN